MPKSCIYINHPISNRFDSFLYAIMSETISVIVFSLKNKLTLGPILLDCCRIFKVLFELKRSMTYIKVQAIFLFLATSNSYRIDRVNLVTVLSSLAILQTSATETLLFAIDWFLYSPSSSTAPWEIYVFWFVFSFVKKFRKQFWFFLWVTYQ